MVPPRRQSAAPWIVAGIAGAVLVALVVVFFAALLPYRRDHRPGAAAPAGSGSSPGVSGLTSAQFTSDEKAAMAAATTEAANVLSYSRAHFDADFARALAGSTGALKSDIQSKRADTEAALTQGKFDLTAKVGHSALVGPTDTGHGYVVLVAVNGYKSTALDVPTPQNLSVTMVFQAGKWLATDITLVGIT